MPLKVGSNNIGDVYVGNSKIDKIYVGNNLVYTAETPVPAQDFILNVQRETRDSYIGSTTYKDDSYIAIYVKVKSGGTATVTYDNVTQTLTSSTTLRFGKYRGTDDGTATSGQLTISGDYTGTEAVSDNTSKTSSSYVSCITGIVQWFGGQVTDMINMFIGQKVLTGDIILPQHIKTISAGAFGGTRISSIYAPHVKVIEAYGLGDIKTLSNAVFHSDGLTNIGNQAFAGCGVISNWSLVLQRDFFIDNSAFSTTLNNLLQPTVFKTVYYKGTNDDWVTIEHFGAGGGTSPFASNTNLYFNNTIVTSMTIPSTITKIYPSTFNNMLFLNTAITIPDTVTEIGAYAFYGVTVNLNVNFNNITKYGAYSFYGTNVTNVTIPNTVTDLGGYVFYGCPNLTTINYNFSGTAGKYLFANASNSRTVAVSIGSSVTEIPETFLYSSSNNRNLNIVVIPSNITAIGGNAFYNCIISTVKFLHTDITTLSTVGASAFLNNGTDVQYQFADTQANVEAWGQFTTTNFTNTTYYPIS